MHVQAQLATPTPSFRAWRDDEVRRGIEIAAASDLPVLISGPALEARPIASWIHAHSRRQKAALAVIEAQAVGSQGGQHLFDRLRRLLAEQNSGRATGGTLLVTHVDEMSPLVQEALFRFMEVRDDDGDPPLRLITTVEGCALDAVRQGRLPIELFYRMNTIHLLLPEPVMSSVVSTAAVPASTS